MADTRGIPSGPGKLEELSLDREMSFQNLLCLAWCHLQVWSWGETHVGMLSIGSAWSGMKPILNPLAPTKSLFVGFCVPLVRPL